MINERPAEVPEAVRVAWLEIEQFFAPLGASSLASVLVTSHSPLLEHLATVRAWLSDESARSAESALDENRIALVEAEVPVVYAWSNGRLGGDEMWAAVCEDGELMASHASSNRDFGTGDVHLGFKVTADRYRKKFGGLGDEFYRFVVVPEGKRPPVEVMEANARWAGALWTAVDTSTL